MKILRVAILGLVFSTAAVQAGQLVRDPSFELGAANPHWGCSERWQGRFYAECGFCDQSHFTRAFRRVHGVCPSRYRAVLAMQ